MGLKADVDFLNQFNMLDLDDLLKKGNSDSLKLLKMGEPVMPAIVFHYLKDVPPIKILELVNSRKAADILTLVRAEFRRWHISVNPWQTTSRMMTHWNPR